MESVILETNHQVVKSLGEDVKYKECGHLELLATEEEC